jgi:hypothetical protein
LFWEVRTLPGTTATAIAALRAYSNITTIKVRDAANKFCDIAIWFCITPSQFRITPSQVRITASRMGITASWFYIVKIEFFITASWLCDATNKISITASGF